MSVDWTNSDVERVARIIAVLNPCGYTPEALVRVMQTHGTRLAAELESEGGTGGYVSTLGFCITIYTKMEGGFGAKCTIEPFTIESARKDDLAVFGTP